MLAAREREGRERQEALERQIAERQALLGKTAAPQAKTPAPWGTAAARRQEIERVRREIEERARQRTLRGE